MGIWGRRGSATNNTGSRPGNPIGSAHLMDGDGSGSDDPLGDALLVLDDLAAVLKLVADSGDEVVSEPAAQRVEELQETRQTLRRREDDPPNVEYGRGEWLTDLCWLLTNQDLAALLGKQGASSLGGPWLWYTEISSDTGSTWTAERSDRPGAGLEQAPDRASDAARFFLDRRLVQLRGEASEYDLEDTWLRVSVWHAHRHTDLGPKGRLAERTEQFSSLSLLGAALWAEQFEPNALAVATSREVGIAVDREEE